MAELFTNTDELRNHIMLDATFPFATVQPYQQKAIEKYLADYVPRELINQVKADLDAGTPDPKLRALLPYLREVVAQFIFLMASPDIDIKVQGMGFQVNQSQNTAVASSQRVERFNSNREEQGWTAVESLLKFLEENAGDYPLWVDSPGCSIFRDCLIRTADEFNQLVDIGRSRLTFFKYRPTLRNVELQEIASDITPEYLAALKKRIADGNLTPADNLVLEPLKMALANLTHFHYNKDLCELAETGKTYLGMAKRIMWASPASYPEFKDSPSFFERADFSKFTNSEEKGFFLFGGGTLK